MEADEAFGGFCFKVRCGVADFHMFSSFAVLRSTLSQVSKRKSIPLMTRWRNWLANLSRSAEQPIQNRFRANLSGEHGHDEGNHCSYSGHVTRNGVRFVHQKYHPACDHDRYEDDTKKDKCVGSHKINVAPLLHYMILQICGETLVTGRQGNKANNN